MVEHIAESFAKAVKAMREGLRPETVELIKKAIEENAPTYAALSDSDLDWDEIAEYARGTCKAEFEIGNTFCLSDRQLDRLTEELQDRDVVLCENCGWWVEVNEMSDDADMCMDCVEEVTT
jgi:uncharacterized protein YktB (UPF0637 family)